MTTSTTSEVYQPLVEYLENAGYSHLRMLNNKVVGLRDYMTTRAIVVGLDEVSYERRYCYQNREEANRALAKWKDESGHPPGNWIKLKGKYKGVAVDMLNPNWSKE